MVVGLGNRQRGDDGAGPRVLDLLRESGLRLVEPGDDLMQLLDLWPGQDEVVLVDAVRCPGEAGRVDSFELPAQLPQVPVLSSHLWSLERVVRLAEVLGRLPGRLRLLGISGKNFDLGTGLSPQVEDASRRVAQLIGAGPA